MKNGALVYLKPEEYCKDVDTRREFYAAEALWEVQRSANRFLFSPGDGFEICTDQCHPSVTQMVVSELRERGFLVGCGVDYERFARFTGRIKSLRIMIPSETAKEEFLGGLSVYHPYYDFEGFGLTKEQCEEEAKRRIEQMGRKE